MNIYKRRATNSPSFVKYTQLTQVPKGSASKIDGGVKHGFPCTGTFKELLRESNYWRGHGTTHKGLNKTHSSDVGEGGGNSKI